MSRSFDVASALAASSLRFGGGLLCHPARLGSRPQEMLVLYDFEACPFCRKVREALTLLDLRALIRPCPRGGTRFRSAVREQGGKSMFPYLVDPNVGVALYESNDIIQHLFQYYGVGSVPLSLALGPLTTLSSSMASLPRAGHGRSARPSRPHREPLALWSFEASPYCRLVRERLCELELEYVVHNVGKRSPSRPAFVERSGKMMVPYLADPNTGTEMHESAAIIDYLERTYALAVD